MADEKELRIVVRIRNAAQGVLDRIGGSISKIGSIAKYGALALVGVAASLGAIAYKMVQADNESEKAEASLTAVVNGMRAYRESADTLVPKLVAVAKGIQATGIAEDDAVIAGTRMLATYKEISDDQLPRAMQVMADLSVVTGDMSTAANLVGKAAMGMGGALRRVGITVDENIMKSKDFNLIMDAVSEQIGDQQTTLRKTGYGGLVAMSNAWGDLMEIGGKAIKSVFGPIAEAAAQAFAKLNNSLSQVLSKERITDFAREAVPILGFAFLQIAKATGVAVKVALGFLGTLGEIYKTAMTVYLGIKNMQDESVRKRADYLRGEIATTRQMMQMTADANASNPGADRLVRVVGQNRNLANQEAELKQIEGSRDAAMQGMRDVQATINKTDQFINGLAGAYAFVDNASATFVKTYDAALNDIVKNLGNYDLTAGGPATPATPAAGGAGPSKEELAKAEAESQAALAKARAAVDDMANVYNSAYIETLQRTEGMSAVLLNEMSTTLETFDNNAEIARAQGLLNEELYQQQRLAIVQNYSAQITDLNKNEWTKILEDTDAATQLMNQQIKDLGQGMTDAMADAMADTIMGVKGGEKQMLAAMGSLIGGMAQQWGELFVLHGIAKIAEGGWPPNAAAIASGGAMIAAGLALKTFGALIAKSTAASAGTGSKSGGDPKPKTPAKDSQDSVSRGAVVMLDFGEMREDDIITNAALFARRMVDEINDAYNRNVTIIGTGGAES